jgi:hypothetical protein
LRGGAQERIKVDSTAALHADYHDGPQGKWTRVRFT